MIVEPTIEGSVMLPAVDTNPKILVDVRRRAPATKLGTDEVVDRFVEQAFQWWVGPEIERRKAQGEKPLPLQGAQVTIDLGRPPVVRLNHEFRFIVKVRKPDPSLAPGQDVMPEDMGEIVDLMVAGEDSNAAHFTIVRIGDGWLAAFDFTYNRTRSQEAARRAAEFLRAAERALEAGDHFAFADTLYTAVELAAISELITFPDLVALQSKTHSTTKTKVNQTYKIEQLMDGNADPRFKNLFNRLFDLRFSRKYDIERAEPPIPVTEAAELLTQAREWTERAELGPSPTALRPLARK